jgi:hypothetical protein
MDDQACHFFRPKYKLSFLCAMQSVFTINPIVVPKPSQSHCESGFPRLTRLSLQSFYPDPFCKAESRITHTGQDFQKLTRLYLQSFGCGCQTRFLRHFYCAIVALYGWFPRNRGAFDGTPADIGGQDDAPASVPFGFYDDHDTRDYFSTSDAPTGSCGLADIYGSHNSVDES